MLYLILALVFIESILIIMMIYSLFFRKQTMNRLEIYFENQEVQEKQKAEKIRKKTNYQEILGKIGNQIMRILIFPRFKEKLNHRLEQADSLLKVEEYIAFGLIVFLSAFYIGWILSGNIIVGILMALLGVFLINSRLKSRIRKRTNIFNEQLGDALEMMAGTLRAGFSLNQSLQTVAEEMPDPVAKEFKKVVKELSVGVSLEESLYNLLNRIVTDDLELLVTAILIQRQIGGNLAEILDNISGTIRQRINLKGEVKTLTAQGKMSGWIISLLPIVFSIIILLLNPEYILTIFQDPMGWLMVIMAVIGQIMGIFMIRRIIDIQY